MTYFHQAEDFRLTTLANINSASFYAISQSAITSTTLAYQIYADASGTPGTILSSGNAVNLTKTLTGQTVLGSYAETLVSFNLASVFTAAANTTYWLGLQFSSSNTSVYWETANTNGTSFGREVYGTGLPTSSNGNEHAFSLATAAAVPEPATWAMMLIGFGMIGAATRYRRRSTAVVYA